MAQTQWTSLLNSFLLTANQKKKSSGCMMGKRVRAKGDVKMKTFMSVPPCGLCFKAPNGYVPLAGFRSDRAEIAFSPFSGGSQPSHFESGSSLKLLYLRRNSVSHELRDLFLPNYNIYQRLFVLGIQISKHVQHTDRTSSGGPSSPHL